MANHNPHRLPPGPGRPKGKPNKLTVEAKKALEMAFEGAGGVKALTRWAKENPDSFYPVWSKLLPKNIDMTSGGKTLAELLTAGNARARGDG